MSRKPKKGTKASTKRSSDGAKGGPRRTTPPQPNELRRPALPAGKTRGEDLADMAVEGICGHAAAIHVWSRHLYGPESDVSALAENLALATSAVRGGQLGGIEAQLAAQFSTLNAAFLHMLSRAASEPNVERFELYLRLGLKAQSQCRATAETLAQMKMPPVFAKQANIANGPQQVNNGAVMNAPSRALTGDLAPNKLLEAGVIDGERVDRGTESAAARSDSAVEAMEAVDWTANRRGQGACGTQRVSGRRTSETARVRPDVPRATRATRQRT